MKLLSCYSVAQSYSVNNFPKCDLIKISLAIQYALCWFLLQLYTSVKKSLMVKFCAASQFTTVSWCWVTAQLSFLPEAASSSGVTFSYGVLALFKIRWFGWLLPLGSFLRTSKMENWLRVSGLMLCDDLWVHSLRHPFGWCDCGHGYSSFFLSVVPFDFTISYHGNVWY